MLGLTFNNKGDYDLIQENDLVDVVGLKQLEPGKPVEIRLHHSDGTTDSFPANHTGQYMKFSVKGTSTHTQLLA